MQWPSFSNLSRLLCLDVDVASWPGLPVNTCGSWLSYWLSFKKHFLLGVVVCPRLSRDGLYFTLNNAYFLHNLCLN